MSERLAPVDLSDESRSAETIPVDVGDIQGVLDEYPVHLAVLFGSTVSGETDAQSDLDIAVEFDDTVEDVGEALLSLLTDLSVALDRNDIDLALVDDLAPRVGRAAFTHGVLLCGSVERAAAHRDRFEAAVDSTGSNQSLRDRFDETLERVDNHVERGT